MVIVIGLTGHLLLFTGVVMMNRLQNHKIVKWLENLRLLKWRRNLIEQWRQKSPKQKWLFIYNINDIMLRMLGIRILNDMKIYWFTCFCIVISLIHFPTSYYTIWIYYERGDILTGMQCTCSCGALIPVMQNSSIILMH